MLTTAHAPRLDIDSLVFCAPILFSAALEVPPSDVPEIPTGWRRVYGREVATATQRFVAYTSGSGVSVALHSTIGLHPELTWHLIALVNLGGHRVAVHAGERRFEARWSAGTLTHRLTAEPLTLGAFMNLVLNLGWR